MGMPRREEAGPLWTLPSSFYTDPAILQREKEAIFYRSWLYAGHASRLKAPGSYLVFDMLDQSVIVLRGLDGVLRGFHNVCQHRAHRLLEGRGCTPVVTCPYHAWAYGLDGRLRTARGAEKLPGFDHAQFSLKPVAVEEFLCFVMVNLDAGAQPFARQMEGLADEMRREAPWLDTLVPVEAAAEEDRNGDILKCNWKVLLENCTECLHCTPSHPAFVDLVDLDTYRITTHAMHTTHTARATKPANAAYAYPADSAVRHVVFWHIWPNMTFGFMPGSHNFGAFCFEPVTATTTRARGDRLELPGTPTASDVARNRYGAEVLWIEDKGICESVQRGLASRGYDRGRIMVNDERHGASEHVVGFFQQKIREAIGA